MCIPRGCRAPLGEWIYVEKTVLNVKARSTSSHFQATAEYDNQMFCQVV